MSRPLCRRVTRGGGPGRGGDRPWRVPAGCSAPPGPGWPGSGSGRPGWRTRAGSRRARQPAPHPVDRAYPFYGDHQAGIVTPAQDRLHFAAFDVITDDRDELIGLLRDWTAAAARMTQGLDAGEMGATSGSVRRSARRHRGGDRAAAVGADASPSASGPACSARAARTGSGSPTGSRRRCGGCRTSRPTTSTRRSPTATCACRPAPTTRRSRCTPSATWPGSASAGRRCAGRSWASGVRRRPRPRRAPPGTCSASRTAPPTSRPRSPRRSTSTSGCRRARTPRRTGWRAAAIWWRAGST